MMRSMLWGRRRRGTPEVENFVMLDRCQNVSIIRFKCMAMTLSLSTY